ncbi:MAG: GDP-L-fucose synthase [Endomicrobium sp.]|jgi:GDP-L-fucose synthase|nr:GDP-L-fucose synthase [Endomicrobium sp.]
MNKNEKIYIAGHSGLFGSALMRRLKADGHSNIICASHNELDLTDGQKTMIFFKSEKPDYVFCAAAKVGGIHANSAYMADFAMENTLITCNLINSAHKVGVKKLLYLGSSCIYPRKCPQPIKEEYMLTAPLEPTNEGYALAKIIGVRLCDYYRKQYGDDFISCMPANLYGQNDCYDESKNHVVPALIKRFHNAKIKNLPSVEIWGTGKSRREFMYIDDAADACVFLMDKYDSMGLINVGIGIDTSIGELAGLISDIVEYKGKIVFDTSKPDGMPKRILDSSKILKMGWTAKTPLYEGLQKTYQWFLKNIVEKR